MARTEMPLCTLDAITREIPSGNKKRPKWLPSIFKREVEQPVSGFELEVGEVLTPITTNIRLDFATPEDSEFKRVTISVGSGSLHSDHQKRLSASCLNIYFLRRDIGSFSVVWGEARNKDGTGGSAMFASIHSYKMERSGMKFGEELKSLSGNGWSIKYRAGTAAIAKS